MPLREYTRDVLPALLDFVEKGSSWGDSTSELGRRTFQETLAQPGLAPEDNCALLEEDGRVQGFCSVFPEIPIARAVIEVKIAANLAGGLQELELVRWALGRAKELRARVVHVCLPESSAQADTLKSEGFTQVQSYWEMVWRQDSLLLAPVPDGFTVRPFQAGDAALLAEVQNSAFAASWGFCPNTPEQIEYRSSMANTSHQGILFLVRGEMIAGYCWTCLVPVKGNIRGVIGMIGVVPDFRGQGISHSILLAGMHYLRNLNVSEIGLEVDGSNTPGVRLYTSVGFQKVGERHWFELELS